MSTYSSDLSEASCSFEASDPASPISPVSVTQHKHKHKSKKHKRKHHSHQHTANYRDHHEHFDDENLVKYYKYLYEQKCKESAHYKKLFQSSHKKLKLKNKECEQLMVLNQQYQGRVIAYLLDSHNSYTSSISRCSSQSDIRHEDAVSAPMDDDNDDNDDDDDDDDGADVESDEASIEIVDRVPKLRINQSHHQQRTMTIAATSSKTMTKTAASKLTINDSDATATAATGASITANAQFNSVKSYDFIVDVSKNQCLSY